MERNAHVVGQTRIDWEGEVATLRSVTTAWRWHKDGTATHVPDRPADLGVIAFGEDTFVEHEGQWLIVRRTISYHGIAVSPGGLQ